MPFFKAGGRVTAGDVHFVEQQQQQGKKSSSTHFDDDSAIALIPAGKTEFSRDAAFGYRSSNLVDWVREKWEGSDRNKFKSKGSDWTRDELGGLVKVEGQRANDVKVTSVSIGDLRKGGPAVVRERLKEAKGGCVVVNAVEERDLQVIT